MSSTQLIIIAGVVFWLLTCWAVIDIARKDFGRIEKKSHRGLHRPGALPWSYRLFCLWVQA